MRTKEEVEKVIDIELLPHRPPVEVRDQLDHCYEFDGREFVFSELRSIWNDPSRKMTSPILRSVYVKSKSIWKVYWMRADLKWHLYKVKPDPKTIELMFRDPQGCFFG